MEEKVTPERLRDALKDLFEVVEKKESNIRIVADKCSGCGRCVELCPVGVLEMEGEKAKVVAVELCHECGTCFHICPEEAIEWTYPEGGTGIVFRWS
ncbi:MAG: ferredoxin family protein [Candidatus Syntropharchaeia archaeon]